MPLVVAALAAAIRDLYRTDQDAGRKVTWLNMHPLERFGFARFEARVNVNALTNRRWTAAIFKSLGTAQNLFCIRLTNAKSPHPRVGMLIDPYGIVEGIICDQVGLALESLNTSRIQHFCTSGTAMRPRMDWSREMFNVTAPQALPRERSFFFGTAEQL
jgi:hypothetical protein